MKRNRNAKIVATLGPATSSATNISDLFEAGVDVFRMNFSHGSHEEHRSRYEIIRNLEKTFNRGVGVLLDLQGPKLRVGKFFGGKAILKKGQRFRLDMNSAPGDAERIELPHCEIFSALKANMTILLDDGRISLKVLNCDEKSAETEVIVGGKISDHKGVNVPSALLDVGPFTEKDREDLIFGLDLGVEWIGLSFVQRVEDIVEAQKLCAGRAAIMAKLEKPAAINQLESIVDLCDAIMVARGDLGVEMDIEGVPVIQRKIIQSCRKAGKPVIVATQMLESMVNKPTPTRAEASDVATAIYNGADAVMLSAESAIGEYPIESVRMMDRIICRVEQDPQFWTARENERRDPENTASDAITAAARQVAETISAVAVITFSSTGSTTLRAARERPFVPILGLTPRSDTARKMSLTWGVHSVQTEDIHAFREMVTKAITMSKEEGFAKAGDSIVITAGVPFGTPGATNILRIAWVE